MLFSAGHVKLQRITAVEREERKRLEKKEKKEKDDEEERNRLTYNFVKYTLGLKHLVSTHGPLVYLYWPCNVLT